MSGVLSEVTNDGSIASKGIFLHRVVQSSSFCAQLAWRLCTIYTMLEILVLYCLCGHGVMGSLEQDGLMAEDTSAFRYYIW